MAGLVVIQERDESRLAAIHQGHVRHLAAKQELLDPLGDGAVGVPADPGSIGSWSGDGPGGGGLVGHGRSISGGALRAAQMSPHGSL